MERIALLHKARWGVWHGYPHTLSLGTQAAVAHTIPLLALHLPQPFLPRFPSFCLSLPAPSASRAPALPSPRLPLPSHSPPPRLPLPAPPLPAPPLPAPAPSRAFPGHRLPLPAPPPYRTFLCPRLPLPFPCFPLPSTFPKYLLPSHCPHLPLPSPSPALTFPCLPSLRSSYRALAVFSPGIQLSSAAQSPPLFHWNLPEYNSPCHCPHLSPPTCTHGSQLTAWVPPLCCRPKPSPSLPCNLPHMATLLISPSPFSPTHLCAPAYLCLPSRMAHARMAVSLRAGLALSAAAQFRMAVSLRAGLALAAAAQDHLPRTQPPAARPPRGLHRPHVRQTGRREGRGGVGGAGRQRLVYGPDDSSLALTRTVQRDIWLSQFPPGSCDGRHLLIVPWVLPASGDAGLGTGGGGGGGGGVEAGESGSDGLGGLEGLGLQVHVMGALLGLAVETGRVLVPLSGSFSYANNSACKAMGQQGQWGCYFSPIASSDCSKRAQKEMQSGSLRSRCSGKHIRNVALSAEPIVCLHPDFDHNELKLHAAVATKWGAPHLQRPDTLYRPTCRPPTPDNPSLSVSQ
ncbi:unnamed protein product, partial [Closterium sp. Naga37s-1]